MDFLMKYFKKEENDWNMVFFTASAISSFLIAFLTTLASIKSPYLLQSGPFLLPYANNFVIGYSYILGGIPIQIENIPGMNSDVLFQGGTLLSHQFDKYMARPAYGFLVSTLSPYLDFELSSYIVNGLAWMVSCLVTWRFSLKLFGDGLISFIAMVFTSIGIGWVVHVADHSAHLLSFSLYYGGVLIIYESNVWKTHRGFPSHLLLGLYMSLSALCYNNANFLIVSYLILSYRYTKNCFFYVQHHCQ